MLKITNVTIKNFLSVGNVTQAVRLDDNGLTLVLGSNPDANGGTTRNGAGKSTILQAISFGLFGKPLTKIKLPNLINNINGKGMMVTVEMNKGGTTYRIERGKKPDLMRFYVNNEEQKLETDEAQGENKQTQIEIDRLIGMSHTMFKHIVALNTFTDPFLKMSVNDQRAVIEELLGVTQISSRADMLKKLIVATKEEIRNHEAAIRATLEANERITAAIRQAQTKVESWEVAHNNKVIDLAQKIEEALSVDFDAELSAFDALDAYQVRERNLTHAREIADQEFRMVTSEVTSLRKQVAEFRNSASQGIDLAVSRLQKDQGRKLAEAARHKSKAEQFAAEAAKIVLDIENADSSDCVCCGQKLEGTDHLRTVIASLERQRDELIGEQTRELEEASAREDEAQHLDDEIVRLADEDVVRRGELESRAIAKEAEAVALETRQSSVQAAFDESNEALRQLGERPVVNFNSRDAVYRAKQVRETLERDLETEMSAENPFVGHVDDLTDAIQEIDTSPLDEANDLLKHQDFLTRLLTSKDSFIRKRIIDQNLSYLNSRLNLYLDKLGLPHEVRFQSDLSVDIILLGRDFDFEQLSRGEMNRVIMATSWAFRDVWESMNSSCNLLWVDELLDQGTDGQGVEAALSVLKSMARDRGKNVFLISHRDELQSRIDRTLLVRKENGFTSFEPDGV